MKKLFLFLAILSITYFTGFAQKIQLGFTGGLSIANYEATSNNNNESSNPKAGFTVGAIARIALKKHLMLQPEINWVQKGTKDKQSNGGVEETVSLTTNSIEVPVNIMYTFGKGFFVGGGPSFSYAVSGKLKASLGGTDVSEKIHFGNGDNDIMKAFDFGINVSGGYKFKNGFLVSANYNAGTSNLSTGKGTSSEKLFSNYFGIKIGYVLSFRKKN